MTFFNALKPCHHAPVHAHKGTLLGLAGVEHTPEKYDLNIFLSDTYLPEAAYGVEASNVIYYPVSDGQPPKNIRQFSKLINYTVSFLKTGKTVAVSCIGGHGRTGLVLACLITKPDPIKFIRQNYCPRAIESWVQEKFIANWHGFKVPETWVICNRCHEKTYNWHTVKSSGWTDICCDKCSKLPKKEVSWVNKFFME